LITNLLILTIIIYLKIGIGISLTYYIVREELDICLREFETDTQAAALNSTLTAPNSELMQKQITNSETVIIILLSISTISMLFFG